MDPYRRVRLPRGQRSYLALDTVRGLLLLRFSFGILALIAGIVFLLWFHGKVATNPAFASDPKIVQEQVMGILWQFVLYGALALGWTALAWHTLSVGKALRRWWYITPILLGELALLIGPALILFLQREAAQPLVAGNSPAPFSLAAVTGPETFMVTLLMLTTGCLLLCWLAAVYFTSAALIGQLILSPKPLRYATGLVIDDPTTAELPTLAHGYLFSQLASDAVAKKTLVRMFRRLAHRRALRAAFINGMFAGFSMVHPRTRVLQTVLVHSDFKERGVAGALLEDYLRNRGRRKALMEVAVEDEPMQATLKAKGWVALPKKKASEDHIIFQFVGQAP